MRPKILTIELPDDSVSRGEYEAFRADLKADIKILSDKFDQMKAKVDTNNDNYHEWKGRALLMMYVIPVLTGIIGFLLGIRF